MTTAQHALEARIARTAVTAAEYELMAEDARNVGDPATARRYSTKAAHLRSLVEKWRAER